MIYVELRYPVIGATVPSDHGYAIFSAISRVIPEAHNADWLSLETGLVNSRARLRIRVPQDRVPLILKLAGRRLGLGGHRVRLGAPRIFLLKPSSSVYARCVTIKNHTEPNRFLDAVAHKLDEMGIRGEPEIGLRRAFRVGNHTIVGFGLSIHDLSDEGSIVLQERGMGKHRNIGCGFFVPVAGSRKTYAR
jgi:CRISPR-associated endonuclease/helicase Cas3